MASSVTSPDFIPFPRPDMTSIVDPLLLQASHSPPPSPTPPSSSASSRHSSTAARRASQGEDLDPNTYQIAPPPEQEYSTPQVAEGEIHAWTKALCYEVSRTKSDKNKDGVIYKQYYKCARHGKPSNTRKLTEETRVRRRAKTRRTGCPMGIVVKAVDPKAPEGRWRIHHQMNRKSFIHNHPPAVDANALSGHRRRACAKEKPSRTARASASTSGAR